MDIGNEATVAGVQLCWAELTPKVPGVAHSGTAEHLHADEDCQLVLAPLGVHLAKARPCPVVCRTWRLAAGLRLPPTQSFLHVHPAAPAQASVSLIWATAAATFPLPSLPPSTHQAFFFSLFIDFFLRDRKERRETSICSQLVPLIYVFIGVFF